MRGVDGDAARLFLRRRVDLVVGLGLATKLRRQHQRDRRRQRRLAMVHVPNRAHVHVRLRTLKFAFCHLLSLKERLLMFFLNHFVLAVMIASATFFGASV